MNIVVIGAGYVGLVTACCLAHAGNRVVCVDHDVKKVAALERNNLPFHEPGLDVLLGEQLEGGRLAFETSVARAMRRADIVFLAVGTPARQDGSANLDNLLHCARELANTAFSECIVVVKSTVPVGTGDRIEEMINARRAPQPRVHVVSNPEFLAEGRAVRDFMHPDRIVVGSNQPEPAEALRELYAPFDPDGTRMLMMDRRSAEFAKYACNAMLAARISMVNELAGIAGQLGADMGAICRVLQGDPRIGSRYLHPGVGYGGSCLPKDLRALIASADSVREPAYMLRSAQRVNERQGELLFQALQDHFDGSLKGRRIGVWGLSFKPGTDDVRAAPSLALIQRLVSAGARVTAYDPVAMNAACAALGGDAAMFGESAFDACDGADALVVMTEWEAFRAPDFAAIARLMRSPVIFDARNIYETEDARRHGIALHRLGEPRARVRHVRRGAAQIAQSTTMSAPGLPRTAPAAAIRDGAGQG